MNEYLYKGLMYLVHRTKQILDLNSFLVDLRGNLAELTEDPTDSMRGKVDLFGPEFASKSGFLKDRATERSSNEETAAVYLRYMLHKCLCCLERVKPEFLPGGKYAKAVDEKLRCQTASVPTSNRRNEATFGKLDNIMRDFRRMKSLNMAALIKGQQNGTTEWLSLRSDRQELVQIGRKVGQETVKKEKDWETAGRAKLPKSGSER